MNSQSQGPRERYPGMKALATKLFKETPREKHGELSREMKYFLEAAKMQGVATSYNWASQNLELLRARFGNFNETNYLGTNKAGAKPQSTLNNQQLGAAQQSSSTPVAAQFRDRVQGLAPGQNTKIGAEKSRKKQKEAAKPNQQPLYPVLNGESEAVRAVGKHGTHGAKPIFDTTATNVNSSLSTNNGVRAQNKGEYIWNRAGPFAAYDTNRLENQHLPSQLQFLPQPQQQQQNHHYQQAQKRALPFNGDNIIPDKKTRKATAVEQRRARFEPQAGSGPAAPYVDEQIRDVIVGTSTQLEKSYFRLTGQVNPAAVRPPAVLAKALELVLQKYAENNNYHYLSSQLQSIRQDLTVQHIETELTVRTYEMNTRLALLNDDVGEFNKCLTRVMDLYERVPECKHSYFEFKAYSILYMILRRKWNELSLITQSRDVSDFSLEHSRKRDQSNDLYPTSPEEGERMLDRALICAHSVERENTMELWNYSAKNGSTWQVEQKLLSRIIERGRARALEGLLIAFHQQNQSLPLKDIGIWLGLHDMQKLRDLLKAWNIPLEGNKRIRSTEALPLVRAVVSRVDGKFDIKGQI